MIWMACVKYWNIIWNETMKPCVDDVAVDTVDVELQLIVSWKWVEFWNQMWKTISYERELQWK